MTNAPPRILLADPDEWDAAADNVRAVLESVAAALLAGVPHDMPPVVVRAQGGPIALYEKNAEGHWQVNLSVNGPYWAQYAF